MNNQDPQACPFYQHRVKQYGDFDELVDKYCSTIVADMEALGLHHDKMVSAVNNAASLGARSEMAARESAVTPLFYDEVSREGNVKPVTHPIHTVATTLANAYGVALKQLGIYASAEKVKTKAKREDERPESPFRFDDDDED